MTKGLLELQKKIVPFAKKNGLNYVAVFGSFARGEQTKKSDIDLMVQFSEPIGLFKFVDIKMKLEKKLKREVDLVTPNGIRPRIKNYILSDLKTLYEKR